MMNYFGRRILSVVKSDLMNSSHVCCLTRKLSFRSAYSLENLYPKSNLNLFTPKLVPENPASKFSGYIPLKEIEITYSTSSGPGGQNVNCVNTKVDLRFKVKDAFWLDDEIRNLLIQKHANKINKEGYLIIKSDLTRSQQLNVADALQKLRQMIRDTIVVPAEPSEFTQEKHRKKQLKAAQERVFIKRRRSDVKRFRRGNDLCD